MSLFISLLFLHIIYYSVGSEYSYEVEDYVEPEYNYRVEDKFTFSEISKGKKHDVDSVEAKSYEVKEKAGQHSLQSPIQLPKNSIKTNFERFNFNSNTYKKLKATLTNNGDTIVVRFPNKLLTISGGGLHDKYIFDSLHFHWFSEHTIEDHRYPLEAHFVYYNEKHKNLGKALSDQNGVAVLGVVYKDTDLCYPAFNFVSEVKTVSFNINQSVTLKHRLSLVSLLPSNLHNFYRYSGSLTTPNFNEVVTWTVFSTPLSICKEQMMKLTSVYNEEGELVEKNYRELQEINGRRIYFNNK